MVELRERTPARGLLPLEIGAARLEEMDVGRLTSLSPFGDASDMAAALEKAHGIAWPKPGRATGRAAARCLWFGHREVLLMGPGPDAALSGGGAVVDQSDAWTVVVLEGASAEEVLARLVPVDMRATAFKRGHTLRTQVQHMSGSITRLGADRFMILVFRSMAATLVQDMKQAMAAVASRGT